MKVRTLFWLTLCAEPVFQMCSFILEAVVYGAVKLFILKGAFSYMYHINWKLNVYTFVKLFPSV